MCVYQEDPGFLPNKLKNETLTTEKAFQSYSLYAVHLLLSCSDLGQLLFFATCPSQA